MVTNNTNSMYTLVYEMTTQLRFYTSVVQCTYVLQKL